MTDKEKDSKTEDLFIEELKSQFDREIDLRKNLDTKATQMITIASSLITINLAIGTFLIVRIADRHLFYYTSLIILGLGIVLAVKAIWKLFKSYGLRDYVYPFGHTHFFKNGEYDESMVDGVRYLPESQFKDRVFRGYLKSIRASDKRNREKAADILNAQASIVYTLVTIAFLVGFVLVVGL